MLVFLQRRPFEADIPVPKEFWTNPYFIRFFYNIVRYWSRLYLKREPDENEFAEIFMKTIYCVTNSTSDMLRAENTLRESFSHMLTAGEFAAENYGASLSRAVSAAIKTGDRDKGLKALMPQLEAAQKAEGFMRGTKAGLIYVALVAGDRRFDDDKAVRDARRLVSGEGEEAVAGVYMTMTIKAEYIECYGPQ